MNLQMQSNPLADVTKRNPSKGYVINPNTLANLADSFIGINWSMVLESDCLDTAFELFYNMLLEKFHSSIPRLTRKRFLESNEWITPDLIEAIKVKN